ncbi:MAG: hypothetical protein ACLFV0_09140, partial [Nitriliruptoraceae bacterium]
HPTEEHPVAAASRTTIVGTYASKHDAEVARERLGRAGIAPTTVASPARGVWTVSVPETHRDDAIAELSIVEQRRRGPGI